METWDSKENSCMRRGIKERVIMERLERKPSKKLGHAIDQSYPLFL